MLKVLLVTGQVTYMPENYLPLFKKLLQLKAPVIGGIVILKNLDFDILKTTLGITLLGAKKTGKALMQNILQLPLAERERLFRRYSIPVHYFESMNSRAALDLVRSQGIDLIVNLRTRCIYKKAILEAPRLGCINIHHGLLPQYRGTMCDLYALSEGRPAGFSIHRMNPKIDAGEIIKCVEVQKASDGIQLDYPGYLKKTGEVEAEVLAEILSVVEKTGQLPAGTRNQCDQVVFSKNPSRKQIKAFLKQGMIL